MANLQQRLDDLQQRLRDLANRANREDIVQAVHQLEALARALLADAKNTPQEQAAQALFAELARLDSPSASTTAAVRGLHRRARIRLEIAGDEDDIDEAIDLLIEALSLDTQDEDTIAMLQNAASRSPQAASCPPR